jgi:hypothetical protein
VTPTRPDDVRDLVARHEAVDEVTLVGSRARGAEGPLSDWDFIVVGPDLRRIVAELPAVVDRLRPLAAQWDRLGDTWCFMLMLPGPAKVDLLIDLEHGREPPWTVDASTLRAIDQHFWDWLLWLASKDLMGRTELVSSELAKMSAHLLRPMGEEDVPIDVATAFTAYLRARARNEERWSTVVPRDLEEEVASGLRRHGYEL